MQQNRPVSVELGQLRTELERARKDKNISSGLVGQLQRDLTNKDSSISKLTRDVEQLRRQCAEKDVTIAATQAKVCKNTLLFLWGAR